MMRLSDTERTLLADLTRQPTGAVGRLPSLAPLTLRQTEELVDRLVRLGYLSIYGPPNQNSLFGKDIETLSITAAGRTAVR